MKPFVQLDKPRRDQGLSLIELVLAMALFALVAVMGAQGLTGMLRLRDDLETRASQSAALAEITSLLRADLSAMVPMLFYPPDRAVPQPALRFQRRGDLVQLDLSRGGVARFDRTSAAQGIFAGRVEWKLQDGRLNRYVWSSLMPADRSGYHLVSTGLGAQLGGVQDLRLRSYWPQVGWVEGAASHGLSAKATAARDDDSSGTIPEVYSDTLPLAVELTLTTGAFGDITLLESLQ